MLVSGFSSPPALAGTRIKCQLARAPFQAARSKRRGLRRGIAPARISHLSNPHAVPVNPPGKDLRQQRSHWDAGRPQHHFRVDSPCLRN